MKNNLRVLEEFTQANRVAADIILASSVRYGGEESLMVRWARCFLEAHGGQIQLTMEAAA